MKKAVSILVSAICLIAIVFVAIFGTKPQGIVEVTYISSLTIKPGSDGGEYSTTTDGSHQCVITYDPSKEMDDGENRFVPYQFTTEIAPENATNRSYHYTVADNYKNTIDFPSQNEMAHKKGIFIIKRRTDKKRTSAIINVYPDDGGSGAGDELRVVILYDSVYEG